MSIDLNGVINTIRSYVGGNVNNQDQEVVAEDNSSAAQTSGEQSILGMALSAAINSMPAVSALRLIGAMGGCGNDVAVDSICNATNAAPISDITVGINQTLQMGRLRFSFNVIVPEAGVIDLVEVAEGAETVWMQFGLEGSDRLEPIGLPRLDVEGFRMLYDNSDADPLGYVSYRPMTDNIWGDPVYIYEGMRVVRHRILEGELDPVERDVWLAVDENGAVMCGGRTCEDAVDAEANALANDYSGNLPHDEETGEVDIDQMERAFAYFYVNENGEYTDGNGNLSESPAQIDHSRNPEGREYELVPDPDFEGLTPEEFRNLLWEGIPEREDFPGWSERIAQGESEEAVREEFEEYMRAISIPLQGRVVITDESGNNMGSQGVPEDGQMNLVNIEDAGMIMLAQRFYPGFQYRVGISGTGEEGERPQGERDDGFEPGFIYGGARARFVFVYSCDTNPPQYQEVETEGSDADADADGIIPGADADGDIDADADITDFDASPDADEDYDGLSDGDV